MPHGVVSAANKTPAANKSAHQAWRALRLLPEIIKVVPVIRRITAVVFETRDVIALRLFERVLAFGARCRPRIDQSLEINIIAVAAAIQAEHQDHRALQQRCKPERAGRKTRRFSKK